MTNTPENSNLPAQIAEAFAGVPKALVPRSLKAIDRLVGAAVDIPVAWLAQQKAKIDARTQAYTLVEAEIAKAAAAGAGADNIVVQNAINVLVRKEYRKQSNREAVATAMIEDLRTNSPGQESVQAEAPPTLDDDWLNVFERYAEDASTERMQNLWGRVLAGEIRKPGKYSTRTLRFLSEFTQADGLLFAEFCKSAFGDAAPKALIKPPGKEDIRDLIFLESSGLIQGGGGLGLRMTITFNANGNGFLKEGELVLLLQGTPGGQVQFEASVLTPLGQELLNLLPSRDARAAARAVANAIRIPAIRSAFLTTMVEGGELLPMEILWQSETPKSDANPQA